MSPNLHAMIEDAEKMIKWMKQGETIHKIEAMKMGLLAALLIHVDSLDSRLNQIQMSLDNSGPAPRR